MLLKRSAVLIFILGITGCMNSPEPPESFHYLLDAAPALSSQSSQTSKREFARPAQVKVLALNLPDYLQQPNLVLKMSNHQIKIANYHFWAEDLNHSIQQILIKELNQTSSTISYHQRCIACDEIAITIDHFYPTDQGKVVLSGSYDQIANDGSYSASRFSFVTELNKGGYDEAVEAMRALLTELAKQVNQYSESH